jgi:hypothetical protein
VKSFFSQLLMGKTPQGRDDRLVDGSSSDSIDGCDHFPGAGFRKAYGVDQGPYQDKPPKVLFAVAEPSGETGRPGSRNRRAAAASQSLLCT